jgi:hypothetical protein
MLAVLITLTPGRRNEFIDCQKAKLRIAVLPVMDVKTHWNSTPQLIERASLLCKFTRKWLRNPKYCNYRPLFTTQDEWNIAKYLIEVLRPFQYWTLWMSKRHIVTLHHVITMEGRLILRSEGCPPEAFKILCRSHSNDRSSACFSVHH